MRRILLFVLPILIIVSVAFTIFGIFLVRFEEEKLVASNVGGIPLQIKHKYSGLLCHSIHGAAFALKQLLNSLAYAKQLGENGREHIRNNFLITRHIRDYLLLLLSLYHKEDVVYL